MSRVALYRKYRSQTFGDLIGQEHVVRTLQNAVKQGNVHHAFLFTGPRGTGKTSTARLMAKVLNCPNGDQGEPCNACDICLSITEGHCIDVIEMDAASEAGVDDVREKIVDVIEYKPAVAKYKVFIIDEVHDLSGKAFDALLKTIEEPPGHIVFILATTELHKVPPTIQSRCQKFQFNRASLQDLTKRLAFVLEQEGKAYEPGAIQIIARMADGGFRDALSLLEQALITAHEKLTMQDVIDQLGLIRDERVDELLHAVASKDVAAVLNHVDEIYRNGRDAKSILEAMLSRLSELTRASFGVEIGGSGEATLEAAMRATATQIGSETILRLRELIANGLRDVRDVSLPRIWLESLLLSYGRSSVAVVTSSPVQQPTRERPPTPERAVVDAPETDREAPKPSIVVSSKGGTDVPPPETDSPDLEEAIKIWRGLVVALSEQSRVAGALLQKSSPVRIEGNEVIVGFARQLDLDQLQDKKKLMVAIHQDWEVRRGDKPWTLSFRSVSSNHKQPEQESAVELPAEGPRLAEMAREVFKNF